MNPKKFYDTVMPKKYGTDYEVARWKNNPLHHAQYLMMELVMKRFVLPHASSPLRIFEIGPGPGTWTKYLLGAAPEASFTLVDISETMLAQAKESLSGNIEFVESDWVSFVSAKKYDFFFSSRALEYVSDKKQGLNIVSSALKKGGKGVIVTKMPKPFFDFLKRRKNAELHRSQINPAAFKAHLCRSNLTPLKTRLATATFPGIPFAPLNQLLFVLLSPLPLVSPLTLFAESYAISFEKKLA